LSVIARRASAEAIQGRAADMIRIWETLN
jgi:hypothetical protein